jgi:ABC-type transport system involved in multi-copper enzyme maturation permease subunit
MYFLENPVLQRELLVNLRRPRSFAVLFAYVAFLGAVVLAAWPASRKIDMTNPEAARRLVGLFFLGQYVLALLLAPSLGAGAIAGEKERKSYEMLLASPLQPVAIVLGKLLAALCFVSVLLAASVPIVMLCLPLGGVSFYEVLVLYWALLWGVLTSGMISIAASSYFGRTAAALVVAYLLILPLALACIGIWTALDHNPAGRLALAAVVLPIVCAPLCIVLLLLVSRRLLYPPDVGSEGKEVVDEEQEFRHAVGMVIQRDAFPDRLFAPPKRTDLLPDDANPVYDKEMRSEVFSQGTLMLRLVIQVSLGLSLPLMARCLYFFPQEVPWYMSYCLLFNMLVGPVFSAGSITNERERQTLDLLLVTTLSPWQIVGGKLLAGLRVSGVLTAFLLWPLILACLMVSYYWTQLPTVAGYLVVVVVTCWTTATAAQLCSVLFRKTVVSLTVSFLVLAVLFAGVPAMRLFVNAFYPNSPVLSVASELGFLSPFSTLFDLPLAADAPSSDPLAGHWGGWFRFVLFYIALDLAMLVAMLRLFARRRLGE